MKYKFLVLIFLINGCFGTLNNLNYKELGDEYLFNSKLFYIDGNVKIPSYVIDYNYNDEFIVALQVNYALTDEEIKLVEKKDDPIYEAFKISKKKGTPYFWIIDKIKDSLYGPLSNEQYMNRLKELNIPENLKIKIDIEK